ncbi:flagellar hook-associated protein FlgK [Roseomonas sp. NAR14]|uniref:Flagellar hook-associated protein 1 n=1 Tax=Roseomonas acroporae TaxID=2937791 RepID=A0A9X1Y6M8_9PROT|nr:flagellar hook-associated protein FlgK [Roseomonas acroporae]MCK8783047.1 flagellar hook-associated protein FlgK [Roseomonas acroporae]
MSLNAALSIAQSGLSYVQRALVQTSNNVANADVAGYSRKQVAAQTMVAGSLGSGVRTGVATRDVDDALKTQLDAQSAGVAAATVRERLLTGVEAAHGTTGGGNSLGSLVSALRNSFSALAASPSDQTLQSGVVQAAQDFVDRVHTVSDALDSARQQAQDGIVTEVEAINRGLNGIAKLTRQIQTAQSGGASTAELEDQRDQAISALSEAIEVKAVRAEDGGITLIGRNGLVLPLQETGDALATGSASAASGTYHGSGGTLPGVTLGGVDITGNLRGGRLAEYVSLRDTVLPQYQSELDLVAANTAYRFGQQGLNLFGASDGAGGVTVPDVTQPYPAGGQGGFAATIAVNPAVREKPSLVRDGTQATSGVAAGFTPNPDGGPAGFTALIDRVLDSTFGTTMAAGVTWPPIATAGLGGDGSLHSGFTASGTLEGYAAQLTTTQTASRADASAAKESATTQRDDLQGRVSTRSGVDSDEEMATMVQLQNAYAANARVMTTVQSMWDALLAAVR